VDYNTVEYLRSNAAVKINALAAYDAGATGAGVVAAVIDSGVNPTLSEFAGRISPASRDVAGTRGMGDVDGHGTSVSAVLLAARDESQLQGVAFDATLLALRTDTPGSCEKTGENGGCTHADANIARAVDIAIANKARVINLSLGGKAADPELEAAFERAVAAGIVIVIAAGNDGEENPGEFALIANKSTMKGLVLIAGGVSADNNLSVYSSGGSNKAGSGANHYVLALGTQVRSIDENGVGIMGSGTSYSAPAISGAVALLADAFPNLSAAQIVDLILTSTKDLGDVGVDPIYGRGLLDLSAAFKARGSTSVAGTATSVSLTSNGTLSAPMGDAGQQGLSTIILDSYGRAYRADLSNSFVKLGADGRLWRSLRDDGHMAGVGLASMGLRSTGLVVAIGGDKPEPRMGPLALNAQERADARALAGWVVSRLSQKMQVRRRWPINWPCGAPRPFWWPKLRAMPQAFPCRPIMPQRCAMRQVALVFRWRLTKAMFWFGMRRVVGVMTIFLSHAFRFRLTRAMVRSNSILAQACCGKRQVFLARALRMRLAHQGRQRLPHWRALNLRWRGAGTSRQGFNVGAPGLQQGV
jgi:Subtilase family